MELEYSRQIFGKPQISNLMKIRPVGAKYFHWDGQTDRQEELIVAFRKILRKAPKCAKEGNVTKQKQQQKITKNILVKFSNRYSALR